MEELRLACIIVVLQGLSESLSPPSPLVPPSPATTDNSGDSVAGHRKWRGNGGDGAMDICLLLLPPYLML